MTREQAQAVAEEEIVELSRAGKLEATKTGSAVGNSDYKQASVLFRAALRDIANKYDCHALQTGDIARLGSLCIELYREAYLHTFPGDQQPPGAHEVFDA